MNVAFLSLGGNIGDRFKLMTAATDAIGRDCGKILKASRIYETQAWGSSSEKKYLNRVLKIETGLAAEALLKKLMAIEKKAGRKRHTDRNADRVMDIDILFYNNIILHKKNIQLPHPRLHLRKFALVPLNEIEKTLVHPVLKKTVGRLLRECEDQLEVAIYRQSAAVRYVCIEGNIGSGKSTLAKALVKKWKALCLNEKFEENIFLPLFYKQPRLYAFPVEYSFMVARFQQISAYAASEKKIIVSDFSFYKCLWFAKINLPQKEYNLFKKHFKAFMKQLPRPDLVIYLDTSIKNLERNIKKRGRPYEQGISPAYLKSISKEYRHGLAGLKGPKKLVIAIKDYHPGLEAESINIIENYTKENFAGQPQKSYI